MSKDASSLSQSIVPAQYQPTRRRFGEYGTASAKIAQLRDTIPSVWNANADYGVAAAASSNSPPAE